MRAPNTRKNYIGITDNGFAKFITPEQSIRDRIERDTKSYNIDPNKYTDTLYFDYLKRTGYAEEGQSYIDQLKTLYNGIGTTWFKTGVIHLGNYFSTQSLVILYIGLFSTFLLTRK